MIPIKNLFLSIIFSLLITLFSFSKNSSLAKETGGAPQLVTQDSSGKVTRIQYKNSSRPPAVFKYSSKYLDILEPGWPVKIYNSSGSYHGGPAIHTLVDLISYNYQSKGNVVVTALATGPLYMFDHQGNLISGWPVQSTHAGAMYPAAFKRVIYTGNYGSCSGCSETAAFDNNGLKLWENPASNYLATPASVGYVFSNNNWGLFTEEEDWKLHGYLLTNGSVLPGWPANDPSTTSQEYHTPAVADIDNDGQNEVITVSGSATGEIRISVFKENGALLWGKTYIKGEVDTFPVIGDVDNDGNKEIIVMTTENSYPWTNYIKVLNEAGEEENTIALIGTVPYGSAPALGDMNQDKVPDIIVQTEGYINVINIYNSNNSWTKQITQGAWIGNSSPVVGDVNGDNLMDIVFTTQESGSGTIGYAHVILNDQSYASGFPMELPIGAGAVPAIFDLDQDGHNEIIITGSYWDGYSGEYDKVWVFDLSISLQDVRHGRVDWGQFGGNPRHSGSFVFPSVD